MLFAIGTAFFIPLPFVFPNGQVEPAWMRWPMLVVTLLYTIAVLLTTLRGRVQALIDRRFYRQKYDAAQVLAVFALTARDETDLDELMQALQRVVEEAMQPEGVGVWLKQ
ncbi:MAG: hypothetical protein HY328_18785 [Chloroflexi bacterium]|nr:hypothetical protein [Chloroflexota bacterium]